MRRLVEQVLHRAHLDDLAAVHHRHALAEIVHHAQVVGDEQVGQPLGPLQLPEQVEDLRAHRNVQGRHRLVGDDQVGLQRHGPGDADALALAAAELMGVAVAVLRLETHHLQQLHHPVAHLVGGNDVMELERVAEDVAHAHARVERRIRVLEHHLDAATELVERGARHLQDLLPLEVHLAAGGVHQPGDEPGGGGLATAALPHQSEGLAFLDGEVDPVHRLEFRALAAEQREERSQREILRQVVDSEDLFPHDFLKPCGDGRTPAGS